MAPFNSTSSRSFRENVLTESIASFFNSKNRDAPCVTDAADPAPSESNPESNGEPSTRPAEKATATTEAVLSDTDSSNHGRDAEKIQTYDGLVDPLAGGMEGGVDYKTMRWWHAGLVMIAETISLGILSLPAALSVLGLLPGIFLLVALGIMASYTGYVIWQFKMRYPQIYSVAEAGEILYGRIGREIFGWGALLFYVFVMGSHVLTFSIMMNAVTDHGACTVVFMVVGMILSFLLTIPRTLKGMRWLCFTSFASVILAVGITMICVAVTKPGFAPTLKFGNEHNINIWTPEDVSYHKSFLAASNIVFAYAGHVAFFQFIAELEKPQDFPKSLALLQVSDISMYIISAIVIYWYAGNEVDSPALDSASALVRKIAYGFALPTIIIAGVVNGHVAVKWVFVKILKNNKDDVMHQKSFLAWSWWIGINAALWLISWLIAELVPIFNDLLGITSALFASWFTFGVAGIFWLNMNWKVRDEEGNAVPGMTPRWKAWGWKKWLMFLVAWINIVAACILCFGGLHASGKSIAMNTATLGVFSCKDNSGRKF